MTTYAVKTERTTDKNPRVATYCDCGQPIVGMIGIVVCGHCGLAYSVSRLPLGRLDMTP